MVIALAFISNLTRRINIFQYQLNETARSTPEEDIGSGCTETQSQHNAKLPEDSSHFAVEPPFIEQSDNKRIVLVKQPPNCIAIGFSGVICEANEDTIVKHPKAIPNDGTYNQTYRDMIINERLIFERLGHHNGIIS